MKAAALLSAMGCFALVLSGCVRLQGVPDVVVQIPAGALPQVEPGEAPVDFMTQVKPILESKCLTCHHAHSQVNATPFTTREQLLQTADGRRLLIPGQPEKSSLYLVTVVPEYFVEAMPPMGYEHQLSREETTLLHRWIAEGAKWPAGVELGLAEGAAAVERGAF